jgi:beta-aspartyl-peptidase (threonine type)
MEPKLIVHGGAWNIPVHLHDAHVNGCALSVEKVYAKLSEGLNALSAVEEAVGILEKDPTFDAGRGAYPVSAARLIMEKSEHCFLVGNGAQKFLRNHQFPEVNMEQLLTERELIYYRRIKSDPDFTTRKPFDPHGSGTVGAVAMDKDGNLAAATSTGGTPRKLPGRVGDSPVIGAGAFADNKRGAVSTTGFGESIMKIVLAKLVCDYFEKNTAQDAARIGIQELENRVNGLAGIIGINKNGEYAFHHNTKYMAFAYFEDGQGVVAKIKA